MPGKSGKDKVKAPVKSVSSLSPKKQRCARSYATGQAGKQLRREVQEAAAARNRGLRARGELTPWEQAKSAAKYRKGPGAKLSEADRARLTEARGRGEVPVVKLERLDVSAPAESGGSNTSSKRAAIREAKRKGD